MLQYRLLYKGTAAKQSLYTRAEKHVTRRSLAHIRPERPDVLKKKVGQVGHGRKILFFDRPIKKQMKNLKSLHNIIQPKRWVKERVKRRGLQNNSSPQTSTLPDFISLPLTSVVIPVYNHADFVAHAIKSVLDIKNIPIECILVNDGSTDELQSKISKFQTDERLTVYNQSNQGIAAALNKGVELAKGEFLTWLSADNFYLPGGLEKLVTFLTLNPKFSLAYGNVSLIDEKGQAFKNSNYRPQDQSYPGSDLLMLPTESQTLSEHADNFINSAIVYRKSAAEKISGYKKDLLGAEDYAYWLELSRFGSLAHVDTEAPLACYRLHSNTLSKKLDTPELVKTTQKIQINETKRIKKVRDLIRKFDIQNPKKLVEELILYLGVRNDFSLQLGNKTEGLERILSPFVKSPGFSVASVNKKNHLSIPMLVELPEKLKKSRSSYYQTSEGLPDTVALTVLDSKNIKNHIDFLKELALENPALGILVLNIVHGDFIFADTDIPKNLRVISIEEDKIEDSLMFALSSADCLLDLDSPYISAHLAACAGIVVVGTTEAYLNIPHRIEYLGTNFSTLGSTLMDAAEGLEIKTLDQWLEATSAKTLAKQICNFLYE